MTNGARSGGDPFGHVGERTISVQVTSVVRASDRSFQVKWLETAYERGALAGTAHWTAILTVVMTPPSTADTLRKNPLGLYIDAIDWSRELEPAGSSAPGAPAAPPKPIPFIIPTEPPLDRGQPDPTSTQEVQP